MSKYEPLFYTYIPFSPFNRGCRRALGQTNSGRCQDEIREVERHFHFFKPKRAKWEFRETRTGTNRAFLYPRANVARQLGIHYRSLDPLSFLKFYCDHFDKMDHSWPWDFVQFLKVPLIVQWRLTPAIMLNCIKKNWSTINCESMLSGCVRGLNCTWLELHSMTSVNEIRNGLHPNFWVTERAHTPYKHRLFHQMINWAVVTKSAPRLRRLRFNSWKLGEKYLPDSNVATRLHSQLLWTQNRGLYRSASTVGATNLGIESPTWACGRYDILSPWFH